MELTDTCSTLIAVEQKVINKFLFSSNRTIFSSFLNKAKDGSINKTPLLVFLIVCKSLSLMIYILKFHIKFIKLMLNFMSFRLPLWIQLNLKLCIDHFGSSIIATTIHCIAKWSLPWILGYARRIHNMILEEVTLSDTQMLACRPTYTV